MTVSRVAVAMSGGVDSSVAAALLKEAGYEVFGVTMKLWTEKSPARHHPSCSIEAVDNARRVCQILDIPFYSLDLEPQFQSHVINYFCEEYSRGRTPNPCLVCNQKIKFGFLLRKALAMGADYLATGHYARIEPWRGGYHLLKGVDPAKDQSYVLYTLGQRELKRLLFPLGNYLKAEIRQMAQDRGLPVAHRAESQELCFIPNGDYREFLAQRLPSSPGEITDIEGRVLGRHLGVAFYTVGQRHHLGLTSRQPLYVVRIDASRNTLVVGPEGELLSNALFAEEVSFVSGEEPEQPIPVAAKIRYKSPAAEAMLSLEGKRAQVWFDQPQRAITQGQAVVFYKDSVVLGGGIIESSLTN